MARIAGVEIPDNKKVKIAITYIHGIGNSLASEILKSTGVDGGMLTKDLTESEINDLRKAVEEGYEIEGELRQRVFRDIKRLKDIRCYRGFRHRAGLPVRGQRTRVNARTRKGKSRVPVGGLKVKVSKT